MTTTISSGNKPLAKKPLPPPPASSGPASAAGVSKAPSAPPSADVFDGTPAKGAGLVAGSPAGSAAASAPASSGTPAGTSVLQLRLAGASLPSAGAARAEGPKTALPVEKLSAVDGNGGAGTVFQLDQDKVQGQRVNLRHIVDPEKGPGLELNFKLRSESDLAAVLAQLRAQGATLGRFRLTPMALGEDGRLHLEPGGLTYDATGHGNVMAGQDVLLEGGALRLEGQGFEIDVLDETAPHASTGKVRLRVFGGGDAELAAALKRASDAAGLQPALAASDKDSEAKLVRARLLWQAAPRLAQQLHESDVKATPLSTLDAWCHTHGVSPVELKRARVEEVFPGHLTVVNPAQAERYKKLGVEYVFAGVSSLEGALRVLASDGLMSSEERMSRGVLVTGASTWEDFRTGGADYVFTRMVTKDAAGVPLQDAPFAGAYQIAYRPEVLGRTDWFAYPADQYGNTRDAAVFEERKYGEALVRSLAPSEGFASSNEVMFQRGLANGDVLHVFTQTEEQRAALVKALGDAGVTAIGDRPVEEVVVVREKMVEMTAELFARRIDSACAAVGVAFPPELERFVLEAAKKLGSPDKANDVVKAALSFEGLGVALERLAAQAGLPAPSLRYDEARLRDAVRAAFAPACLAVTPEIEALFAKLDAKKLPPDELKGQLQQLTWGSEADILEALAAAAGAPAPKPIVDADALCDIYRTHLASTDLLFGPELEAFLRAVAASGKASAYELRSAAGSLGWGDAQAALAPFAEAAGAALPVLKLSEEQVLKQLGAAFAQEQLVVSPALRALVVKGIEAGEVEAVRALVGGSYYGTSAQDLARALAKKLGVPAPSIQANVAAVQASVGTSLAQACLKRTPELDAFVGKLLDKGVAPSSLFSSLSSLGWSDEREVFAQLAKAHGLAPPKLVVDEAAVVAQWRVGCEEGSLRFTPELKAFVEQATRSGKASVHELRAPLTSLRYNDATSAVAALAEKAGVPAPALRLDAERFLPDVEQTLKSYLVRVTPEVRAFLEALLERAPAGEVRAAVDQLHNAKPNALFAPLAEAHGLTAPAFELDGEAFRDRLAETLEQHGLKKEPALAALVEAAKRGADANALLGALANLAWDPPEKVLGPHLEVVGAPVPALAVDVEGLSAKLKARFAETQSPFTPEIEVFLGAALPKLTVAQAASIAPQLGWDMPHNVLYSIAEATGVPGPAMG